eukprot:1065538-Rhodomonas_salina.3
MILIGLSAQKPHLAPRDSSLVQHFAAALHHSLRYRSTPLSVDKQFLNADMIPCDGASGGELETDQQTTMVLDRFASIYAGRSAIYGAHGDIYGS